MTSSNTQVRKWSTRKRSTPYLEQEYRAGTGGDANYEKAEGPNDLTRVDWAYRMGYDQGVGMSMQYLGLGQMIHSTEYKEQVVDFRMGRRREVPDGSFTLQEVRQAILLLQKKAAEMEAAQGGN